MSSPDRPCAHCPRVARGLPMPCRGETHPRFCQLAEAGDAAYIALLCDSPPPSFPPLREQAGNLAGAVGRFVASGLEVSTPEEQARRLAICRSNECGRFLDGRCRECGCRLMAKVKMATEHCPLDPPKW